MEESPAEIPSAARDRLFWGNTSTFTAKLTASDGLSGDALGGATSICRNTVIVGACSQSGTCVNGPGKAYVFVEPASGWSSMTQTAELTAADGLASDGFGDALGCGGNTVVVGAAQTSGTGSTGPGKAYIFVEPASGWTNMTQTAELRASDGKLGGSFGLVSVSNIGAVVFVGAPGATIGSNAQQGAAYIFARPATGWRSTSRFKAKLTASDGAAGDSFGFCQAGSTCISGDGKTVVVGAPQFDFTTGTSTGAGKAYIFVETGSWVTTSAFTAELTASDGQVSDLFGWSESINTAGTAVVLGAIGATVGTNSFQGAVYFYNKPASGWKTTTKFAAKLTAADGAAGDILGFGLALSGNTVMAGALNATIGSNAKQGAAYVFGP